MSPTDSPSAPVATICIAVCTRNRAERLRAALASLVAIEGSTEYRTELLVVNNASVDHTERVVSEFAEQHPQMRVRYVSESQVGFAYARNRVLDEASTDWIAFFDDDQIAHRRWLVELWAVAKKNNAKFVGGAVELKFETATFEKATFEKAAFVPGSYCRQLVGETDATRSECQYGAGFEPGMGNVLVRRDLIEQVGRFTTDQPGRGEDTRLFAKLNTTEHGCWFAPRAKIVHVISAERNQPAAYRRLAKACSQAGDLGWRKWGWLLPFVGITRLIVVVVVNLPGLIWFSLFGSPAKRLDQQCVTILNLYRSLNEISYGISECLARMVGLRSSKST